MVMTTSDAAANSRGVAARFAPCATRSSPREAVRFHTVSSWPAFSRLAPIGWPINPNPINPTGGFMARILLSK